MTLVKTDHPRRIDRVIDYFGNTREEVSNDPRVLEIVVTSPWLRPHTP